MKDQVRQAILRSPANRLWILARTTDPDTSKAAAKRASRANADAKVGMALLSTIEHFNACAPDANAWTDERFVLAMRRAGSKLSPTRVRHARLWLQTHGYIEDTGERARTSAGGTTRLWRLSDKGKA